MTPQRGEIWKTRCVIGGGKKPRNHPKGTLVKITKQIDDYPALTWAVFHGESYARCIDTKLLRPLRDLEKLAAQAVTWDEYEHAQEG